MRRYVDLSASWYTWEMHVIRHCIYIYIYWGWALIAGASPRPLAPRGWRGGSAGGALEGPRWRRRHLFTRFGFTRANTINRLYKYIRFWTVFQRKFGVRLTSRKNGKRAKASEVYDGQECAEIRQHTAARSLDTEKVGQGFFFFQVQYRIAAICGIAASRNVDIHTHTFAIVLNMVYTQDSPPKTSPWSGPVFPQSGADTSSTPAACSSGSSSSGPGARVNQGLGSRGNVGIHRAQVISGWGGFAHRAHNVPPCRPLSPL